MNPWMKNDRPPSKCIQTVTTLPTFVDVTQAPQRRSPFASLRSLRWAHTLDIVLPAELLLITEQQLAKIEARCYSKVMLKLQDILTGEFFNQHIKSGNICMLSEGRPGVDNNFYLQNGVLYLSLDHATYERAGLQGKVVQDGGQKHKKNRYLVELDLRKPSMLHGKKGFERVIWAARNVLNQSLTWLYIDCSRPKRATQKQKSEINDSVRDPVELHHPRWFTMKHSQAKLATTLVPQAVISSPLHEFAEDPEFAASLDEWLALAALQSPLIQGSASKLDPYNCRYSTPSPSDADIDNPPVAVTDTVRLRWRGFLPFDVLLEILDCVWKASAKHAVASDGASTPQVQKQVWTGALVHGFNGQTLSILARSGTGSECLEWEHKR